MPQLLLATDALLQASPARGLIDRLGNKWVLLAIAVVAEKPIRFGNLRRRIEGISQKMLSQTLRALERDGLIERRVLSARPLAVEYRLTPLGSSLAPVAAAIKAWAEAYGEAVLAANTAFARRQEKADA